MSNKNWYLILGLFAAPLLVIMIIAYIISFVLTGNIDNTDLLPANLATIHSAITGESTSDLDEFSPENIAKEADINSSVENYQTQSTAERLAAAGYEILYNEDINSQEGNEIIAVKAVDLTPPDTYEDMIVVSDLRVYTEGGATGNGWPLLMLDEINLPTSILSDSEPPKNNLFALKTEWDPNGRVKFTICPVDHQGNNTAQCGGYIWDGRQGRYDFYGGGKNPEWDNLK